MLAVPGQQLRDTGNLIRLERQAHGTREDRDFRFLKLPVAGLSGGMFTVRIAHPTTLPRDDARTQGVPTGTRAMTGTKPPATSPVWVSTRLFAQAPGT